MDEITLQLPEPIFVRLHEQALKADVSLADLISQHLMKNFDLAVCTEGQARQRALKLLREHGGYMLRTGTPIFEAKAFVWRVPVLPNLKHGTPQQIGEIHLKADTGEILTDTSTVLEMADKAALLLGVQRFDEGFQKQVEQLSDKNNRGELSQTERLKLEEMVQKMHSKDLENLHRLVEQLRLPKANREKAFAALEGAAVALENSDDAPDEKGISAK